MVLSHRVLKSLIAGWGVLIHHLLQLILEHLEFLEQIVKLLCLELELVPQETLELHGLRRLFLIDVHCELDLFLQCLNVLLSGKYV